MMKTNLGSILIVLFLAFGGFNAWRTTRVVTVPPAATFVCTAAQHERGECEPQTTAPVRAQPAPAPAAKQVVAPAREPDPVQAAKPRPSRGTKGRTGSSNLPTGAKVRVYKGFTCGDVRSMVQQNGEDGAEAIARMAGATDAEIALAKKCMQWGLRK